MIAVLPAAGRGTRMMEIGDGSKELLPVGRMTVLERVVREARAAGCEEVVVVNSPQKRDIARATAGMDVKIAIQEEPRGLAEAILLGASLRPALVLLPDTVFHPESPALRLINALARDFDFSVAVERVDEDQVSRYGIVEWDEATGRIMRILEKPSPAETASRWAIAARFAIGPRTLHHLQTGFRAHPQEDGEAQLTPFLNSALGRGHIGIAVPLGPEEQRFDCGNPQSYRRACEVLDGL